MEGLEDDMTIIKSLIAISSGGLPLNRIEREFHEMNGSPLDVRKYGYNSLRAMLQSSREIILKQTPNGIICRVNDDKMSHITSLVERTRVRKVRKKNHPSRSYNTFKGYSSHQGNRTGLPSSPYHEQRRQPFQPVNVTRRYDNKKNMAPTRALTPSKKYFHSGPATRTVQSTMGRREEQRSSNAETRTGVPHANYRYQPKPSVVSSTTNANWKTKREVPKQVQVNSVTSTLNSDSDWSSDSSVHDQVSKNVPKSNSGNSWSSNGSDGSNCPVQSQKFIGRSNCSLKSSLNSQDSASKQTKPNAKSNCVPRAVQAGSSRIVEGSRSSNLNITISSVRGNQNSKPVNLDSDWSSDSDSESAPAPCIPSQVQRISRCNSNQSVVPLQSVAVSSSLSKPQCNIKESEQSKMTGPTSSVVSSSGFKGANFFFRRGRKDVVELTNGPPPSQKNPDRSSPPLMVGGVGRGKSIIQTQVKRPGMKDLDQYAGMLRPIEEKRIVVTGSPGKREAQKTFINGQSTIVVKLPNGVASSSIQDSRVTSALCHGPFCNDFQFIGDQFLLEVAVVSLGSKVRKYGSTTFCGLCQSNLTILKCVEEIKKRGISEQVVMMIGLTDILEGASIEQMKKSAAILLKTLEKHCLVLLTLPVPPSFVLPGSEKKLAVLEKFNKWLLSLSLPNVIDIDQHLLCDSLFYQRVPYSRVESFTEEGCWVVMDEILKRIYELNCQSKLSF